MGEMTSWILDNHTGWIVEEDLVEAVEEFTAMSSRPFSNTNHFLMLKLHEHIEKLSECILYLQRDIDKRVEFTDIRQQWLDAADGMMYTYSKEQP